MLTVSFLGILFGSTLEVKDSNTVRRLIAFGLLFMVFTARLNQAKKSTLDHLLANRNEGEEWRSLLLGPLDGGVCRGNIHSPENEASAKEKNNKITRDDVVAETVPVQCEARPFDRFMDEEWRHGPWRLEQVWLLHGLNVAVGSCGCDCL